MPFYLFLLIAHHHPTRGGPETAGGEAEESSLCGEAGLGCGGGEVGQRSAPGAVSEAASRPSLTITDSAARRGFRGQKDSAPGGAGREEEEPIFYFAGRPPDSSDERS